MLSKRTDDSESPCILSDESQTREKLRRGRPFSPESIETVAERGRHAPKRQVRARTVARDSQARIAPQGREKPWWGRNWWRRANGGAGGSRYRRQQGQIGRRAIARWRAVYGQQRSPWHW